MVAAYGMLDVGLRPEWVEPGVQFNAAAVSLLNGESQRIIPRIDARAGKPLAPRFQRRAVQGVGIRAHLEKHGVQLQLGAGIQDRQQLRTLGSAGKAGTGGPVNVMDGGNPRRAEFLRGGGDGFSGGLPPQRLGGQGQQGAGKGMEKGKSGHDGMVRNASGTFNAHSVNLSMADAGGSVMEGRRPRHSAGPGRQAVDQMSVESGPETVVYVDDGNTVGAGFIMASRVVTPRKLAP